MAIGRCCIADPVHDPCLDSNRATWDLSLNLPHSIAKKSVRSALSGLGNKTWEQGVCFLC